MLKRNPAESDHDGEDMRRTRLPHFPGGEWEWVGGAGGGSGWGVGEEWSGVGGSGGEWGVGAVEKPIVSEEARAGWGAVQGMGRVRTPQTPQIWCISPFFGESLLLGSEHF